MKFEVLDIRENPDGSMDMDVEFDDEFERFVKEECPEESIENGIVKILEDAVDYQSGKD